jgi:mono/diheme cytochrome c family protein
MLLLFVLALAGCRQEMADQPRYDALEPSDFFGDRRSARPKIPDTVARGQFHHDPLLHTGRVAADDVDFADEFPFELDADVLLRGQERFNIFCSICHGYTGHGNGKIVERGYLKPPDYHTDFARGLRPPSEGPKVLLRDAPAGYLFDVITNGYGGMPAYDAELAPRDRWAIVAYIRTLQFSQRLPADKLTPEERERLPAEDGGADDA